jgi:hypothetical protein
MLHSDFLIFKALKNRATAVMKLARGKYYTSFIEENSHTQAVQVHKDTVRSGDRPVFQWIS